MIAVRVVFLDIDGVLNNHRIDPDTGYCWIQHGLVRRFNRIIRETGAKIVVSSAWRYMVHCGAMTAVGFSHLLKTHRVAGEVVGVTVKDEEVTLRSNQIQAWLNEHPEVWSFVVLDDEDMDGLSTFGPRFVHTDSQSGLSEADVNDAIVWLLEPV